MGLRTNYQRVLRCGLAMLPMLVNGCGGSSNSGATAGGSRSVLGQTISQEFSVIPVSNAFDDARLTEASGVQRSLVTDGVYYIHNDSGGEPVLYASDSSGNVVGSLTVTGAASVDWEAIGGMQRDGVPSLIIADIGDNDRERSDLELLVIEEPGIGEFEPGFEVSVTPRRIGFSYGDGLSYDAEALYVDGDNDTIVVLTKEADATSQSIWKGSVSTGLTNGSVVLQYSGVIGLESNGITTAITDVDINPNGREIAVLTYGSLLQGRIHLWTAQEGEGTTDALMRSADETINVPLLDGNLQAEGISYSPDGNYLLVSAEGRTRSILTVVAR